MRSSSTTCWSDQGTNTKQTPSMSCRDVQSTERSNLLSCVQKIHHISMYATNKGSYMENKCLVTNGFSFFSRLTTWTTDPARKTSGPPLYIVIATIIILSSDRLVGDVWTADLPSHAIVGHVHVPQFTLYQVWLRWFAPFSLCHKEDTKHKNRSPPN